MPGQTQHEQLAEIASRTYMQCIDARPIRTPWAPIVDALLKAGMRPPARVITDRAELNSLPDGTVILDANEEFYRLNPYYRGESPCWFPAWLVGNALATDFGQDPELPATVLHTPENGDADA